MNNPGPQLVSSADEQARVEALDPKRSFIVQAPAGSGKTELLIQRYLALLGVVDDPENVVAITFTRKAAAEMRKRVLDALNEKECPPESHKRVRWEQAQKVLERDRQRNWGLMQSPSRLRIVTIDSLCSSIVKLMPWTSNLGTPREIEEDASDLYAAAAHRTVQLLGESGAAASAVRTALRYLDNNVAQVEELLAGMLARRDQWLRHMQNGDTAKLREQMERTLRRIICRELELVRDAIPATLRSEIARLANIAAGNLNATNPAHQIGACRGLKAFPECDPDVLQVWCGIAALLLTNEGGWRADKGISARVGFPTTHRDDKEQLIGVVSALRGRPGLDAALHAVRELPLGRFDDKQWEMLEALLTLLPIAVEQMRAVFQEDQRCDFSEVARAAQLALGTREKPTDLALALGHTIEHLLVDEFQDTSISQVQMLETLTGNWRSGDGRTIFLVGDPMQSIYRFRQAEVGSFLRISEKLRIGEVGIEYLALRRNFRSGQNIVGWVNETFPSVFPDEDDSVRSQVTYKAAECATQSKISQSEVVVHPYFGADATMREAEGVSALVASLRQRGLRVAVLVRARAHLFDIVQQFRAAGIPYQAVDIDPLSEEVVIGDLYALTMAMLHLGYRVAWLATLRAPWCGLTLADLHRLCGDGQPGSVWRLLQENRAKLSADGQHRVARILPVLEKALALRGRVSLRHWIESTWVSLNGPACLKEERDLDNAEEYFSVLDELEQGGDLPRLEQLQDRVSALYARPDAKPGADAVQVMTIHKAKGLEFDAVVVPGLERFTRSMDRPLLLWDERPGPDGPELLLAPIRRKGSDEDRIYSYLQLVEVERGDNELRRLLYVVATRAKKELHLSAAIRKSPQEFLGGEYNIRKHTFLRLIWGAVEDDFVRAATEVEPESESISRIAASGTEPVRKLRRLTLEWQRPECPAPIHWKPSTEPDESRVDEDVTYEWAGELVRRIGTVTHAALQRIGYEGLAGWDESRVLAYRKTLRAALVNQGVSPGDLDAALKRAEGALLFAVVDQRGRWILGEREDAKNEYALTGYDQDQLYNLIIDRTFIDDGIRWIIDYKTGSREGGESEAFLDNEVVRYKEKMERYARVLRKIDSREIRIGLYFPLMRGWREWNPFAPNSGS